MSDQRPDVCIWSREYFGSSWQPECTEEAYIVDVNGAPPDNFWKYCPWCGKQIDMIYDPTLPRFDALDWFKLDGRGDVATVVLDRDCQRSEMMTLFSRVRIDGVEYTVKGVETFAVEQQRKGWTIGLLVGERKMA